MGAHEDPSTCCTKPHVHILLKSLSESGQMPLEATPCTTNYDGGLTSHAPVTCDLYLESLPRPDASPLGVTTSRLQVMSPPGYPLTQDLPGNFQTLTKWRQTVDVASIQLEARTTAFLQEKATRPPPPSEKKNCKYSMGISSLPFSYRGRMLYYFLISAVIFVMISAQMSVQSTFFSSL